MSEFIYYRDKVKYVTSKLGDSSYDERLIRGEADIRVTDLHGFTSETWIVIEEHQLYDKEGNTRNDWKQEEIVLDEFFFQAIVRAYCRMNPYFKADLERTDDGKELKEE